MIPIQYVKGDATEPHIHCDGPAVIAHICNDIGAWGAGFVLAISNRFGPGPRSAYQQWAEGASALHRPFALGQIQIVPVGFEYREPTFICNMLAQHGVGPDAEGRPPIRYAELDQCLTRLAAFCLPIPECSVHMPRIGCGLAGGKWEYVEVAVKSCLADEDIPVTVYDF